MTTDPGQLIAVHSERLRQVESRMSSVDKKLDAISETLTNVQVMVAEQRGAWKAMWRTAAAVGGACGTVAALLLQAFRH